MEPDEKPFRTHNQMLKILRGRGLIIENGSTAKRALERENYYCIINGYKDIFIDKSKDEETFLEGTTFDEIYSLFCLDRELKQLLLPALIKSESYMKSLTSYYFHKYHPEKNSYLAFENYTNDSQKTKEILQVIAALSAQISKQKNNAVTHYIENYHHCPLWVLVNFLTFGNISRFFRVCDKDVRLDVAKMITKNYESMYHLSRIRITHEMIDECIGAFVMFRNVCAHDERLYNYQAFFKEHSLRRVLKSDELSNHNLFSILVLLKPFLKKDDYRKLLSSYRDIFKRYKKKFSVISIEDISSICGYDSNWISLHC